MQNKQKMVVLLGISMIMASSLGLLTQKITLENYYKEKFEILINRVIPKEQYLVNVDIELSEEFNEKEGTKTLIKLDKKTSQPDLEEDTPQKEETVVSEEEDFFDLFGNSPAEPQKEQETKKAEQQPEIQQEVTEMTTKQQSGIENFNISIYLDPSVSTKQTQIQEILCESVYLQNTNGCSDCECISFNILDSGMGSMSSNNKAVEDSGTNENVLKEYELLIEQMRDDREREEAARISKETKKLEKELKSIENMYESLRTQNRIEDSTKLAFYERKDRNLQRKRDSLLVVLEDKTEKARIAYYQQGQDFQQRQFDVMMELVKMKNGGEQANNEQGGGSVTYAPRPPYQNGNSSNMMMILILIIVLCGFIGMFFAIRQKPKPVYLKPKVKKDQKQDLELNQTLEQTKELPKTKEPLSEQAESIPTQNNDVLKSEVKSLRQSAVSMSVGQREAATQILQDWLDEPSQESNQDESEKEE